MRCAASPGWRKRAGGGHNVSRETIITAAAWTISAAGLDHPPDVTYPTFGSALRQNG
jgi:hypothetical protein